MKFTNEVQAAKYKANSMINEMEGLSKNTGCFKKEKRF